MKEKNNNNTNHNNGYLVFFVCFTTPTQKTDFMNTDPQLTSLILNLKIKHHIPQLILLTYPYHPHTDKQIISLETWKIKRLPLNLVASTTNVTKCYLQFITCASYNCTGIHLMGSRQEKTKQKTTCFHCVQFSTLSKTGLGQHVVGLSTICKSNLKQTRYTAPKGKNLYDR